MRAIRLLIAAALTGCAVAEAASPPFVLSQPPDLNLPVGYSANLAVSATGSGLTYQWYKDGTALQGGTGPTWAINNAAAAAAGHYLVIVSNGAGNVASRTSAVVVQPPVSPIITTGVQGRTMATGSSATLAVTATGTAPFGYQWFKDGTLVGTSPTLSLSSVTNAAAGNYSVTISNSSGSATSSAPVAISAPSVAINTQPNSAAFPFGTGINLSIVATGVAPLSYQWYFNGTPLSNISISPYTYYAGAASNSTAGSYTVLVTAGDGSTVLSDPAVITVTPNPVGFYIPLPSAITVLAGTRASLGGWSSFGRNGNLASNDAYQFNGVPAGSADPGDGIETPILLAGDSLNVTVTIAGYVGNATSTCPISVVSALTAAPIISVQPPGYMTVPAATRFTINASAIATGGITAQWYKDGVAVGGGQSGTGTLYATYVVSSSSSADAGTYTCTFIAGGTSVTTNGCPLTALPLAAPVLPGQTTHIQILQGTALNLYARNTGGDATYQWYFNGAPIAGATQSYYTSFSISPASAGSYYAVATNATATVTGGNTVVTVSPSTGPVSPAITVQPVSQAVAPGTSVQLTATAIGDAPLSYQWYKGGTAIPLAVTSSYAISPQPVDAGSYSVTVTNASGSATSAAAVLTVIPPAAPAIIAPPSDQTTASGGSATFTVQALGATTYQWRKNGAVISGATAGSFVIPSASAADAGAYSVTVSNSAGTVTSGVGNLVVATVPSISAQPSALTVPAGSPATFSVSVSPGGAMSFQWFENGTALHDGGGISGSTSATLNFAAANSPGTLTVQISDAAGATTSASAELSINTSAAPVFAAITQSQTLSAGSALSLAASFTGSPAPSYQWYLGGNAIAGATSATYAITAAQLSDAGSYTVVATNASGTATSAPSVLNVTQSPVITTQPISGTITTGGSYNFVVGVSASPAAAYQWMLNGQPIVGATAATYSVKNAAASASGSYAVAASNSVGSATSSPAWLIVNAPAGGPVLAAQPVSQTISPGDSVVFSVSLSGNVTPAGMGTGRAPSPRVSDPATYLWYFNGNAIAGASSSTYVARPALAGAYTCLITTTAGSMLSNAATVNIINTPDPGRLVNLSVLSHDGPNDQQLTVGFVTGAGSSNSGEPVLIRVVGPGLAPFGVSGVLADPTATLYSGQSSIGGNSGWTSSAANQLAVAQANSAVGAFSLAPGNPDAAFLTILNGGPYTVSAGSVSKGRGNALAEIYDATAHFIPGTTPRLINLSCLQAIPGSGILTAGFVVGGSTSKTFLIRGTGPALAAFGLSGTMPDPALTLFSGQKTIAGNAGWSGAAWVSRVAADVGAFPLNDSASGDSALVISLVPGPYTVQATSKGGVGGKALIEVYEVP